MCLICVDLQKEKLTSAEAYKNYREMETVIEPEHIAELYIRIIDRQLKENEEARLICTD